METQKECSKCGIVKSVGEFYKRSACRGGIESECKLCHKKRGKKHYWANRDRRLREIKEYRATHPDIGRACSGRYKKKHPERTRAHEIIHDKVRRGKLQCGRCDICGQPDAEGHHPDYNKPDKVIWLCKLHHTRLHYEATTN